MRPATPVGSYGSFAPGGAAFYATAAALRTFADDLRQAGRGVVDLVSPPAELVEEASIRQLLFTIQPSDQPAAIGRRGDVLVVAGGSHAMSKLAETMENLADSSDQLGGTVPPHVDLEYFPGHGFLDSSSMWLTLVLIEGV